MSAQISNPTSQDHVDYTHPSWLSLYRVGGVAAMIATVLFLTDIVVLVISGTPPDSAQSWFTLFQGDKAAGLIQLFFTDLIGVALMAPIVLALYAALRHDNPAYSALATALAFVGMAVVFAANANYSLIYLSNQYTSASTPEEASRILMAAEALFTAGSSGTGVIMASLVLEGALLMISFISCSSLPSLGRGSPISGSPPTDST